MCRPRIQRLWPCTGIVQRRERRVGRPSGVAAPPLAKKLEQQDDAAEEEQPEDSALICGKAMSRAPIISGTRKFPNPAANGMRNRKIIVVPWIVTTSL